MIENSEERLSEYISHRLKREEEIIEVLKTLKTCTPMTITSTIYKVLYLKILGGSNL